MPEKKQESTVLKKMNVWFLTSPHDVLMASVTQVRTLSLRDCSSKYRKWHLSWDGTRTFVLWRRTCSSSQNNFCFLYLTYLMRTLILSTYIKLYFQGRELTGALQTKHRNRSQELKSSNLSSDTKSWPDLILQEAPHRYLSCWSSADFSGALHRIRSWPAGSFSL